MVTTDVAAAINRDQLGVVFNRTSQQRGYITGEIALKAKSGADARSLSGRLHLELMPSATSDVYTVSARTPAEFVQVLLRLRASGDLEWSSPVVIYGPLEEGVTLERPALVVFNRSR